MPDDKDKEFKEWYSGIVKKLNKEEKVIDPNPNDWRHYYDYRKAFKGGVKGPALDKKSGEWHWPSKYKHDLHPNRFVKAEGGKWLDTKYDKIVDIRAKALQKTERDIFERRKDNEMD